MSKPYTSLLYDRKKKKPVLKIKILQILALMGEFSKKKTESYFQKVAENLKEKGRPHYSEISDAFDSLLQKRLVERRHSFKEKPYRLTLTGLEELLYQTDSVEECWRYAIGYFVNTSKRLDIPSLWVIYDTLNKRFVPYQSIRESSYILNLFKLLSERFIEKITKEHKLILKILRILVRTGEMSLERLASETRISKSVVLAIMEKVTMDCAIYTHIYESGNGGEDPETQRLRFMDFLQHCIVFSSNRDGHTYYELSLFGILLLLAVLRNKNKVYTLIRNRDTDWEEFLDNCASIYCNKKLPLIFGKWPLLKKCLKLWRFYNFDLVLSNEKDSKSSPFAIGGIRELSEGMYSMYVLNYMISKKMFNTGERVLEEFKANLSGDEAETNCIDTLDTLSYYLRFRQSYLDIDTQADEIFYELRKPDNSKQATAFSWGKDRLFPLKLLEKSLEDEITLEYYINLTEPDFKPSLYVNLIPAMIKDDIELRKENPGKVIDSISLTSRFKLLLEKDLELRYFIMDIRNDATKYFEDLQYKVGNLFKSILDN